MDDIIDFAIVGAGVAGTYVAWRLANTPIQELGALVPARQGKPTIRIFEATPRIGGRLHTEELRQFRAELGGMRYTPNQILLNELVSRLPVHSTGFEYPVRLMY